MGSINTDLQTSVSLTYDKTKTSLFGRMKQKIVNSEQVISAPLTKAADVYILTGAAPSHCVENPNTGRKFELQNVTTNQPIVLGFTFDEDTGDWLPLGKIIVTLPIGVHSFKSFSFDDTDPNNIKIVLTSAVTTALCNGGTFYTWGVTLADFTISGTTIYSATQTNQKGVYFAQATSQVGLLHTGITSGGVSCGALQKTVTEKLYQQNGTSTTLNIYEWDFSLGNPSVNDTVVSGIESKTTVFAGTTAYFKLGASQLGYSTTVSSAAAFQAVILQNGLTNVPANFTQTANNTLQTVYYMRDLQFVGADWYFNLSTTSTGAAVVPSTNSATFTMMRAGGISTSHFSFKTGNIAPVLVGNLLQAHSFGITTPPSIPSNPALNNVPCLFFATNSTLYMGKISDLSSGATSWASLTAANLFGTTVDFTNPSCTLARYCDFINRWVFLNGTHQFLVKQHLNNSIDLAFGRLTNEYLEAQNKPFTPPVLATNLSINMSAGWLFTVGSVTGQRVVVACDLYSDHQFGNTYFITKVLEVDPASLLASIDTEEVYGKYTEESEVYIRSATTSTDPIFNDELSGWILLDVYNISPSTVLGPFFQLKFMASIFGDIANSPAQIKDVSVSYENLQENSNDWAGSVDNTSRDGETPTKTAFRMIKSTSGEKIFRAYDDAGNLYHSASTSANFAQFSKTTDNGLTVSAMASANDYSSTPHTTEIIYNWATPPSIRVTCSLRDA